MNKILHGDSLELLKDMEDNSVDSIVTDPPYGYSFMGKDWDKAVPSVELWEECLRVLKPGSFAFIMSAPRSDVQSEMIKRLEKAGFRVDFTPIYWTYATGFPKAGNIGKMIDKRLCKKGKVIGKKECGYQVSISKTRKEQGYRPNETNATKEVDITTPESDEAIKMNGSYTGFNPKPAVEVVIVVMKPLSENSYLDQAMNNGKGVTWLDDCRIPFEMDDTPVGGYGAMDIGIGKPGETQEYRSKDYKKYLRDNVGGDKNFDTDTEGLSRGKHPSRKKKSDYDKDVEKQKSDFKILNHKSLPEIVYMLVDKKVELDVKSISDFPEWSFLPENELKRNALILFSNQRTAKRSCSKNQRVIKIPNTSVFEVSKYYLILKGITRLILEQSIIALDN